MLQFWANADITSKRITVKSFAPESFFGCRASGLSYNKTLTLKVKKQLSSTVKEICFPMDL